jgi:hypothetical protein
MRGVSALRGPDADACTSQPVRLYGNAALAELPPRPARPTIHAAIRHSRRFDTFGFLPMPSRTAQKAGTLQDRMILIVATAVGMAAVRPLWEIMPRVDIRSRTFVVQRIHQGAILAVPLLLSWTVVAVLLCYLRVNARARQELMKNPGFVGCLAAMLAAIVYAPFPWLERSARLLSFWEIATRLLRDIPLLAGLAVVVSWIALAASGNWRGSRHWSEDTARGMAAIWMLLMVLWYAGLLMMFFD